MWLNQTRSNTSHASTRSELFEKRKQGTLPHPSFDLDGDGVVNQRDFFLASLFDQNRDGRLDTAERRNAENALRRGLGNGHVGISTSPLRGLSTPIQEARAEKKPTHLQNVLSKTSRPQPAAYSDTLNRTIGSIQSSEAAVTRSVLQERRKQERRLEAERIEQKHEHTRQQQVAQTMKHLQAKLATSVSGGPSRSQQEMQRVKKTASVPDASFDLDGDGVVSHRDFYLAKHFDRDQDGRLNEQEREAAQKALPEIANDRFQDYFSFNFTNKKPTRHQAIMQKSCRLENTRFSDTFNRVISDFEQRPNTSYVSSTHSSFQPHATTPVTSRGASRTSPDFLRTVEGSVLIDPIVPRSKFTRHQNSFFDPRQTARILTETIGSHA
eukprot:TRINITY_DN3238_c0_g1_i1.p1 TRINITY_DN3238_c0_g1~~TRINITY_DN3238_c0_g1_i1.p1  ORF type:complete len:382 (+),score=44.86 TRINITY_DN3238_c0_g1_i1:69-1214(+)